MPIGSRSDHVYPRKSKSSNSNDGARTDKKGQGKENRNQGHVIQVKEGKVMAYAFHQQSGRFFHIKGPFLPNSKDDGNGPQMLTVKELLGRRGEIILSALRNLGVDIRNGSTGSTALPLLLAKYISYHRGDMFGCLSMCHRQQVFLSVGNSIFGVIQGPRMQEETGG